MSPQLGGNWTTFSTLFYKPCSKVAETSMNGLLSVVSVFIAGKHCATAAKLGMQSTIDLGSSRRVSGSTCFNLLYKHLPCAKQPLSVFPLFNYRLQLQNLSLFCKNCERRNTSSSPSEHRSIVFSTRFVIALYPTN